jgi:hypothetical protein
MVRKYKNNLSLIICVISSIFVVLKMYTGSNVFLFMFLLIICSAIIFDKIENKFIYLLFFISWIYTLKFHFNQFSLFLVMSALYIIVCLIYILIHNSKFQIKFLLSYILFATYVIAVPLFGGGSITQILGFLLNYTVIFLAVLFIQDKSLYGKYISIYAVGLLISSIVRLISYLIPSLNQYFTQLATTQTLIVGGKLNIRFAGADIDPNYYSIQVLIAISCLLVYIYYCKNSKMVKINSILLAVVLSFFGLLSFSKMYVISLLFLILITIASLTKNNLKFGLKFVFSILFLGGVVAFFSFDYFYDSFAQRFGGGGSDLDSLTTGRSTIWLMYLSEILNDIKVLFLGTGYGTGFLNNMMSHNIYLIAFYYMGVIGILITLFYIFSLREMFILLKNGQKKNFQVLSVNVIPLLVLLFANMSVDSFVMDFFPIHLFLTLFSLVYNKNT